MPNERALLHKSLKKMVAGRAPSRSAQILRTIPLCAWFPVSLMKTRLGKCVKKLGGNEASRWYGCDRICKAYNIRVNKGPDGVERVVRQHCAEKQGMARARVRDSTQTIYGSSCLASFFIV